ncbi:MAG TPA: type II secretion system protein [Chryseolinea sp.]
MTTLLHKESGRPAPKGKNIRRGTFRFPCVETRAFTLPEMMVSVAILSIVVVLLSSMVGAVNKAWLSGRQRVENFQNGRAILEMISRELSPALISNHLQFVQNPGTIGAQNLDALLSSGYSQVPNSDSLFWQAPFNGNSYGNVAEYGYFLTRNTTKSPPEYQLQRFHFARDAASANPSPSPTPEYFIFDGPTVYTGAGYTAETRWLPVTEVPWLAHLTADQFQAVTTALSDGVIALWIRCLDANRDPIPWLKNAGSYSGASPLKYNSVAGFNPATPGTPNSFKYTDMNSTVPANRLPDSVEITIVTVDSQTLLRQGSSIPTTMPEISSPDEVPTAVTQFMNTLSASNITTAQVFSTTVRLTNRAN